MDLDRFWESQEEFSAMIEQRRLGCAKDHFAREVANLASIAM